MSSQIAKNLLRIPSNNGSPVNEYRIHEGQIQFRSLDVRNKPVSQELEGWRSLDVTDIQLHFALKTVVSQWLVERLESMRDEDG